MSMFAKPSADTSFQITGGLTTILLAFLLFRMFSAGKWLRRQHEAAAAEGSAQNRPASDCRCLSLPPHLIMPQMAHLRESHVPSVERPVERERLVRVECRTMIVVI